MTTPTTPLELTLPPTSDLLLDDMQLFEPGGFTVKAFKAFMTRYSNWTPTIVGGLTQTEARAVIRQVKAKLNENAVSKETAASS